MGSVVAMFGVPRGFARRFVQLLRTSKVVSRDWLVRAFLPEGRWERRVEGALPRIRGGLQRDGGVIRVRCAANVRAAAHGVWVLLGAGLIRGKRARVSFLVGVEVTFALVLYVLL